MPETVSTSHIQPGMRLVTSTILDRTDFGIPLVEPTSRQVRKREVRVVRGKSNRRVWFTDGTKTDQLHGRTVWQLADDEEQ